MRLELLTQQVTALFEELDSQIARFQSETMLHCGFGCGKCCFKPDIEATVLEFLPFALHLYRQGHAETWYARLKETTSPVCLLLNPTQPGAGLCSEYAHRGLICRLFGYSARTNKHGKKELVTCAIIKSEQTEAFTSAEERIEGGLPVPIMSQYYFQLMAIDNDLSREFYPINTAIRKAIETVMHYYAYREGQAGASG
ncbi:MAG: YkgJ family cysteine cluster protein [Cyclobacteriaceae bacterium]|nr:YkgJ family cysteine cluster protein [Cyclobacteriaceae bacterium]